MKAGDAPRLSRVRGTIRVADGITALDGWIGLEAGELWRYKPGEVIASLVAYGRGERLFLYFAVASCVARNTRERRAVRSAARESLEGFPPPAAMPPLYEATALGARRITRATRHAERHRQGLRDGLLGNRTGAVLIGGRAQGALRIADSSEPGAGYVELTAIEARVVGALAAPVAGKVYGSVWPARGWLGGIAGREDGRPRIEYRYYAAGDVVAIALDAARAGWDVVPLRRLSALREAGGLVLGAVEAPVLWTGA